MEAKKHEMKLYDGPFALMKSGKKTIEVRCNDEKRQKIRVGDKIVFCRESDPNDQIVTRVVDLKSFATFRELYEAYPLEKFGGEDRTVDSLVEAVSEIYSPEKQAKYGALAITVAAAEIPKDQKIVKLEGPDRVRKRPGIFYGNADLEAPKVPVRDLLNIFLTEAQLGYCDCLQVVQKGAELTISGNDRGICLRKPGDDRVWENLFSNFYCPPTETPDDDGYVFELCDTYHHVLYGDEVKPNATLFPEDESYFELYCAQCVSELMDLTSVRDGYKSTLHFEKGYNDGEGLKTEPTEESAGTCFRFVLDEEVFTETVIPKTFFRETLKRMAMLSPGLHCCYVNEGSSFDYCFPNGAQDYVKGTEDVPVYSKKIQARTKKRYNQGGEYEAVLELTLAPALNRGDVQCLHNFRELSGGGAHYRQLKKRICQVFNEFFMAEHKDEAPLAFYELRQNLAIVLASWCTPRYSAWEDLKRSAIGNKMIKDMTQDATSEELNKYIYENKEALRPVVDAILQQRKQKYISIGVTQNGEAYNSYSIPWDSTANAYNMKLPSIYISKEELLDKEIMARFKKHYVVGFYIFCSLEDYSFLGEFPKLMDINIHEGHHLTDLSFLKGIEECVLLFLSKAHLKNLDEILVERGDRYRTNPKSLALYDCQVDDLDKLKTTDFFINELIICNPNTRNERGRWKGVPKAKYYDL